MTATRLSPELLCLAYAEGYFPMPDPDTGRILWFNPDPRAVIPLDGFHRSRSLQRTLRRGHFRVTFDRAFVEVMKGCADRGETWITPEFFEAYTAMHGLGLAHSVEIWNGDALVGGAYGVSLGAAFFAESMFHRETDASKAALHYLVERMTTRGFVLLEVQFLTPHLESLGAREIPAPEYHERLKDALNRKATF